MTATWYKVTKAWHWSKLCLCTCSLAFIGLVLAYHQAGSRQMTTLHLQTLQKGTLSSPFSFPCLFANFSLLLSLRTLCLWLGKAQQTAIFTGCSSTSQYDLEVKCKCEAIESFNFERLKPWNKVMVAVVTGVLQICSDVYFTAYWAMTRAKDLE